MLAVVMHMSFGHAIISSLKGGSELCRADFFLHSCRIQQRLCRNSIDICTDCGIMQTCNGSPIHTYRAKFPWANRKTSCYYACRYAYFTECFSSDRSSLAQSGSEPFSRRRYCVEPNRRISRGRDYCRRLICARIRAESFHNHHHHGRGYSSVCHFVLPLRSPELTIK